MQRLHIHVSVSDLDESIGFYSALFGAGPTVCHHDYAKWRLNDPRVNFAISARGAATGLNHLGIEVEDAATLGAIGARLDREDRPTVTQADAACCYARSDKVWARDPSGIPWEAFASSGSIEIFGDDAMVLPAQSGAGCCGEVKNP